MEQSSAAADDDVDIFTACIFPHSTAADETSAAATEQSDQRLVTFAIPTPFNKNNKNLDDEAQASWSMPDKKHQQNPTTTTSTNQFQKVLTNIESWINCVPLAVDVGSPLNDNNTMVGSVEQRQDSSAATNFTKREVTEFSYMAEREAIINGDILDPSLHNQHKQHHQQPPNKTTSNESETVANLKGVGDTYLLQLAHQTAWNLNIDNAIVDSGTTPKSRNGDISNGRKVDLDDGVAAEAIANKVEVSSSQVNNGDIFSENGTDAIPGGLWKLLPNEMSDEENNNMVKSHDMMEFSLGADSSSSAEEPQIVNEDDYDPILAAQLAVSNAISPNSMNDRYWMDEDNIQDLVEDKEVIEEEPPSLKKAGEKIVKRDDVVEHIREESSREYTNQEINLSFSNEDDIYPDNSISSSNPDIEKKHNYTTDEEANKHFDEIISSFELSLTRNSVIQGRKQPSPRHSNKAQSYEYKKKVTGGSLSSTFLEDTLMGRKLNHTPPASPLGNTHHTTSSSDDTLSRAQKMVNNANEALDSLHKDDCTEEESQGDDVVNLDELELDDSKDATEGVPPGEVDDDMFPNLKVDSKEGGENQDGLPSFDSSVNWDGLAYSMSEHYEDTKSGTSEPVSIDREEVNDEEIAKSSSEVSEEISLSIDQQEDHQEGDEPQNDTGVALEHTSVVPPSPQPPYYGSVDLTPRAWDKIEQIKRRHDEQIGKIRSSSVADSPSQEENIEPSSPNTPSSIAHQPKEHTSVYTPRTQSKIDMEVQERIEKMRLQHQLNMDKMRVCLGDMNKNDDDCKDTVASTAVPSTDNTLNTNDDSRLISNTGRRYNTKRFEKAKLRYSSYRKSSSTPSVHDSKFNFDETETFKVPLSPSEKLMLENKALEEEMRQIRLLSPKSAAAKKDTQTSAYNSRGLAAEVVDTNDKISNLISEVKDFLEESDEAQQNYLSELKA